MSPRCFSMSATARTPSPPHPLLTWTARGRRGPDADVRVLLDGLDVFRTPSVDLFELFAERGHEITENDLGFDELPKLKIVLANQSSYEYPVDKDGDLSTTTTCASRTRSDTR